MPNTMNGTCCVCGQSPVALWSHHYQDIDRYASYCQNHKEIGEKAYEQWSKAHPDSWGIGGQQAPDA